MTLQRRSAPPISCSTSLTSLQWDALLLLREAADMAGRLGQDIWQFAVKLELFRAAGLTNTGLRRLLGLGYVEHSQELTAESARQRTFRQPRTLILPERTCFVITAKGLQAVSEEGDEKRMTVSLPAVGPADVQGTLSERPRWDSKSRQLWWRGLLIKELHRPAPNQETVLAAFEEEGWPIHIDDPLPQTPGIDPKTRLHDTIKHLNRLHLRRGIHFRGDGRGRGVLLLVEEPL